MAKKKVARKAKKSKKKAVATKTTRRAPASKGKSQAKAKRKSTQLPKPAPPPATTGDWAALIPRIREHFVVEIQHLLAEVPKSLWEEPEICGLLYDFLPWHEHSSLSIQLRSDEPDDIGGWKHYECVNPDGRHVSEEFEMYKQAKDSGLLYHRLLILAAEALLSFDFTRFGHATIEDGRLNHFFRLQIYDADKRFTLNYCEYVLARRAEHP